MTGNANRMSSGKGKLLILLMATATLSLLVQFYMIEKVTEIRKILQPHSKSHSIGSVKCKIPDLELFPKSLMKYIKVYKSTFCKKSNDLTRQNGDRLFVDESAARAYCKGKLNHCVYNTIIQLNDNNFTYSPAVKFVKNVRVTEEFIRVYCFCSNRSKIYTNFHAFLHPLNTSMENTTDSSSLKSQNTTINTQLNVIMVGIDSTSRLNSHRQLSGTRRFLLKKLSAIEMFNYNKVADNTFLNIVPMLFGKYHYEIGWSSTSTKTFDRYDQILNRYRFRGYKTLFAEDTAHISTFSYPRQGFEQKPTDYYFRPLSLAISKEPVFTESFRTCLQGRLYHEVILNYLHEFLKLYRSEPHYAFIFLSYNTHDNMNSASSIEYVYRDFLEKIHNDKLLNDTLLLFFSDHGMRFGSFRKTFQGKLEERLPMMYIVPPKWFPERFPRLWKNLRTNSKRLTTPFDIHETLLAALNLAEFERNLSKIDLNRRGISLFAQVPENRTCQSATILPHWCTCQERKKVPVSDNTVVRVAGLIVRYINHLLKADKDKCMPLKLKEIEEATMIASSKKMMMERLCYNTYNFSTCRLNVESKANMIIHYHMSIKTAPSLATFEVTVEYQRKRNIIKMLGDISRTNKYGNQSNCTRKQELKKICYCK